MTNAVNAFGTLLQRQDPIALTWATVSEMRSLTGPDVSLDEKDVTNHSSPSATHEWAGTLIMWGMVAGKMNYNPSDPTQDENTGIMGDIINRRRPMFRLVLPNAGHKTFTFPGFVKDFKMAEPVDDVLQADVSIRIASAPTITGT